MFAQGAVRKLRKHLGAATAADFVYTSESNESCEKHSTQR